MGVVPGDPDMLLELSSTTVRHRHDAGLRLGYVGMGYVLWLVFPA